LSEPCSANMSRSGIAVFNALVSCKLVGRKPLYISTGRRVTYPLTGAGFSVTKHYGWHCEVVFFAFMVPFATTFVLGKITKLFHS
jgi:hypothetical protein